jgi:hypothetical protein
MQQCLKIFRGMLSGSESQKGSENITETVEYINQPILMDLFTDLSALQITVTYLDSLVLNGHSLMRKLTIN